MGTLAKIRRMHLRDGLPIKEIERRTGLARNTIKAWLRKGEMVEPKYPQRVNQTKLDGYTETLATWLKADLHRGKRDRRTIKALYEGLVEQGYTGGYGRVAAFARRNFDAPSVQAVLQELLLALPSGHICHVRKCHERNNDTDADRCADKRERPFITAVQLTDHHACPGVR